MKENKRRYRYVLEKDVKVEQELNEQREMLKDMKLRLLQMQRAKNNIKRKNKNSNTNININTHTYNDYNK